MKARKKIFVVITVVVVTLFVSTLMGCDLPSKTTQVHTWTFEWHCNNASYIEVWPTNGTPSYFILDNNNTSEIVTWVGSSYGGFKCTSHYPSNKKAPWYKRYEALEQVCFYDY